MTTTLATVIMWVLLGLFVLVPISLCAVRFKLFNPFTFQKFKKITNTTGLIYLAIFILMSMIAAADYPLIVDPEFPSPSEIYFGGTIVSFMLFAFFVFLPFIILMNVISFIKEKKFS